MKTFNVFIVDDEPLIRAGLKKMLLRITPLWNVVGEAASVAEAEASIDHLSVDLIITDICMPERNGIDLIKSVKEKYGHIQFIVLSGYTDFDYVRSALILGAADYLVKPIEEDQLSEVLDKIYQELQKRLMDEWQLTLQKENLREFWFHHLIDGICYETETCENQLSQLGIPVDDVQYVLMCLEMELFPLKHEDLQIYLYFLYKSAVELIGDNGSVFYGKDDHIFVILWDRTTVGLTERFQMSGKSIIDFFTKSTRLNVTIGVSDVIDTFYSFQEAWKQSRSAAKFQIQLGSSRIIRWSDVQTGESSEAPALESLNKHSHQDFAPIIHQVNTYIKEHISDNLSLQNAADYVKLHPNYLSELYKQQTGQNFIEYVTKLRVDLAKEYLKKDKMKWYEIAEKVGYTSSKHFSKVFKKAIGVLPSEYKKMLGSLPR